MQCQDRKLRKLAGGKPVPKVGAWGWEWEVGGLPDGQQGPAGIVQAGEVGDEGAGDLRTALRPAGDSGRLAVAGMGARGRRLGKGGERQSQKPGRYREVEQPGQESGLPPEGDTESEKAAESGARRSQSRLWLCTYRKPKTARALGLSWCPALCPVLSFNVWGELWLGRRKVVSGLPSLPWGLLSTPPLTLPTLLITGGGRKAAHLTRPLDPGNFRYSRAGHQRVPWQSFPWPSRVPLETCFLPSATTWLEAPAQ